MYCSLDRVDLVCRNPSTGQGMLVQTDHRTPEECTHEKELSVLFALTKVLGARLQEETDPSPLVQYVAMHRPPEWLRAAIAAAGGQLVVDERSLPFQGAIPDAAALADQAFRDLAARVAGDRQEALGESLLARLEQEVTAELPDADEDEETYWSRVLELAAVTGEVLRAKTGGRWIVSRQFLPIPFAFDALGGRTVNVTGKAQRFLSSGGEQDSPRQLLGVMDEPLLGGEQPCPVMVSFKPATWPNRDKCVCGHLVNPAFSAEQGLPLLVYGQDTPNMFCIHVKDDKDPVDVGVLHRQALENLRRIDVHVKETTELGLKVLVITGSYYASEKLLDPVFVRQMQERLGSQQLLAGIPARGVLMLASAALPENLVRVFVGFIEFSSTEAPAPERLFAGTLVVQDGVVVAAARPQSSSPPPGGFRASMPLGGGTAARPSRLMHPLVFTVLLVLGLLAVYQVLSWKRPLYPPGSAARSASDRERLTERQQASVERLYRAGGLSRDFVPREVAPPGLENAWTVSGFKNGWPIAVKTTFGPRDRIAVAVLYRRPRVDQKLEVLFFREGQEQPEGRWTSAVKEDDGLSFQQFHLPAEVSARPGSGVFEVRVEGLLVKKLPITIVR